VQGSAKDTQIWYVGICSYIVGL